MDDQRSSLLKNIHPEYFNLFPLPLILLNAERQILMANDAFREAIGTEDDRQYLASRPGEAVQCCYAENEPTGCGTSAFCGKCGAFQAVVNSITTNEKTEHECQLLISVPGGVAARDFKVCSTPWETPEGRFYVVTLQDIEDKKRRQILERIFFHDMLNAAGGANGLTDLLIEECSGDSLEMAELVKRSITSIIDNVNKQKELLAVESGDYQCSMLTLQGRELLQQLPREYKSISDSANITVVIDPGSAPLAVCTDPTLIHRALVNMFINALEAAPQHSTVTLGLSQIEGQARFWVHNDGVIPQDVQLQIFKRSFSTKGTGRGLGTYSIKLLTENYMNGTVGFTSTASSGTTFWIELALAPA